MGQITEKTIDIDSILKNKMGNKSKWVPRQLVSWLKRIAHQDQVNAFLWESRDKVGTPWLEACVDYLKMTLVVEGEENLPDPNDGRLYTFETAKKACPSGWHLPENDEWKRFRSFIEDSDGKEAAWMSLKSRDKWDGSDRYGFDVVPAGKATDEFVDLGKSAHFWSATSEDGDAYGWHLAPPGDFTMDFDISSNMYSVRCLKNY